MARSGSAGALRLVEIDRLEHNQDRAAGKAQHGVDQDPRDSGRLRELAAEASARAWEGIRARGDIREVAARRIGGQDERGGTAPALDADCRLGQGSPT
jgi:hypothetical protein